MASVAMETRVGTVEELSRESAAFATNDSYQPLEAGKISGLHIAEIEAVAERLAKDLNFNPGDDLHNVVEKLGGELSVFNPSFDESRFSGTLVGKEPGSFRILVPVRSSLAVENVIIAKELGHYFLHHLYSGAKPASAALDQGEATDPIALSNTEADVFALCFLMPKAKFRKDMNAGADVASLASRYGIPESIVRKRMQLLEKGKSRG